VALDMGIECLVNDAHRTPAQGALDLVLAEALGMDHRVQAARPEPARLRTGVGDHPSSIFIACRRLAFIRPIDSVSTPISSLLCVLNSPVSMLPRLTGSAMPARCGTGGSTLG